jgi:hypothetical protein
MRMVGGQMGGPESREKGKQLSEKFIDLQAKKPDKGQENGNRKSDIFEKGIGQQKDGDQVKAYCFEYGPCVESSVGSRLDRLSGCGWRSLGFKAKPWFERGD